MIRLLITFVLIAAAPLAWAQQSKTYIFNGSFDDAEFSLESAIVDRGLVIDYKSHVGAMLERTKADVGATKTLYANANIFLFCSAALSRKIMTADPMNIAFCPYGLFVMQEKAEGPVLIGYRRMPEGPMKEVEALLDQIARAAVE